MGTLLTEKRKDRLATAVIRVGGVVVILVVVAIVVNIGLEALPLFLPAEAGEVSSTPVDTGVLAVGADPRRELVWSLGSDGRITFPSEPGRPAVEPFDGPARVLAAEHGIHGLVAAAAQDGRLAVGEVRFRDEWTGDSRATTARWRSAAAPFVLPAAGRWAGVTAAADAYGSVAVAAWTAGGEAYLARWDGEDESWEGPVALAAGGVVDAAVGEGLENLAVVTRDGDLVLLDLPGLDRQAVRPPEFAVARAGFLIGGGTLVAAGRDGRLAVLLAVPRVTVRNRSERAVRAGGETVAAGAERMVVDDEVGSALASRPEVDVVSAPPVWQVVRTLPNLEGLPTDIAPSHRDRSFLVATTTGRLGLYHATSGARVLDLDWSDGPLLAPTLAPKGDGALAVDGRRVLRAEVHNPHPEVSLRTLFLPVWYEGYAAPKWVWQSTGGTDAFEPKLSVWPLVFGTLKATLYAMLVSVPLALLAAIYVSQLAPTWLQSTVKPTVELMAAVPSVVVGFLAALWLAPRLEQSLFEWLLVAASLPLAVALSLLAWRLLPPRLRRVVPAGGELGVLLLGCVAVGGLALLLADPLEQWLFGGDLQRFLFTDWGMRYDQRNSLVVGVALGFAVIPVIFTIAEDACSAVPANLVTASRALGATRWQTAIRLVVPAASPGLFAAMMLGLGRAVGETMIVLMAAGNTPLLDLSPFNGMRTMSAAIAVEIPEAPVDGTLFRVLFLTGTLLFFFTLLLTTVADLVGARLRKRYARF